MSIHRWAARTDLTQKSIVEALRKAGYVVELIRKPVDLAIRHPTWAVNRWKFADAKTIHDGEKRVYKCRSSKSQNEFVAKHNIPLWTSPEQALREVAL